ncbi:hypothetical protein [Actinophytocola sp. KF-1]
MKTINIPRLGQHVLTAGLLLATLVGGALTAPAATATPAHNATASPPAIPGVPDVGTPGEGAGRQLEPTIDPHGNPVWPTDAAPRARGGWTFVIAIVDGARIRTRPVSGTVIGLIPRHAQFMVSCKTRARDGYVWGYSLHNDRRGWVRGDLWEVMQFTAPGAPAPRPIPWC